MSTTTETTDITVSPPPEQLQISEMRYRRLFEAARNGILTLDAATRKITDANPFMVELLGYSRAEFVGKELWQLGLLKDAQASAAAFRELQENGSIRYEDLLFGPKTASIAMWSSLAMSTSRTAIKSFSATFATSPNVRRRR